MYCTQRNTHMISYFSLPLSWYSLKTTRGRILYSLTTDFYLIYFPIILIYFLSLTLRDDINFIFFCKFYLHLISANILHLKRHFLYFLFSLSLFITVCFKSYYLMVSIRGYQMNLCSCFMLFLGEKKRMLHVPLYPSPISKLA